MPSDCTAIARELRKKHKGAEIWRVRAKDSNLFINNGRGWSYHEVLKIDGTVIDPMSLGHNNPVSVEEWKDTIEDFDEAHIFERIR